MGIFKAFWGSANGILSEQWKEAFVCNAMGSETMIVRGTKITSERSSNTRSDPNVITDGSLVIVNDGQAAIVTDGGKVVNTYTEPGENVFHSDRSPSIFGSTGGKGVGHSLAERISFGGDVPVTQRIYYVNIKECPGNPFRTPMPIIFRAVDANTGMDMDIGVSCSGTYSIRVCDPALFYRHMAGNVARDFSIRPLRRQMQSEILTVLQPALEHFCANGIRPSQIPAAAPELASVIQEAMQQRWAGTRGLEIVSLGIDSLEVESCDLAAVQRLQGDAVLRDPRMAAATLVGAQASAMTSAASNPGGAVKGVAGLYAAAGSRSSLLQHPSAWKCSCGATSTGNFCTECGRPKPEVWGCSCGAINTGNFCEKCGKPKP